jgi:hypothetical protein
MNLGGILARPRIAVPLLLAFGALAVAISLALASLGANSAGTGAITGHGARPSVFYDGIAQHARPSVFYDG